MNYTIFQVDAFSREVMGGNPAAVVLLQQWLPEETMQAIAAENNLSETAFLLITSEGFELRWFTPVSEVDLCGHATLATAHVLFETFDSIEDSVSFSTRSGILTVDREIDGYAMDLPADPPQPASDDVATIEAALGTEVETVLRGRHDLVAIVSDEAKVRDLDPDFRLVAKLPARGILVSAPGEKFDFVSRCFFPQNGIDEDPVTGSAHTTLAPYWSHRLSRNTLRARQLSQRGGNVTCRLKDDRVVLMGNAVIFLRGYLELPDTDSATAPDQ